MIMTKLRDAGNNAITEMVLDENHISYDAESGKVNGGALSREYLTEEDLRYEQPLNDSKLRTSIAASTLRLIGKTTPPPPKKKKTHTHPHTHQKTNTIR